MGNLIGQSLGRYHILEQLGEGGMAVVYKAYDTLLERDVAVKVIRTEKLAPEILEKALKRFEREAKALAKLSHPNIVKVIDYGKVQETPYLVMEYLPGGTLKSKLQTGKFSFENAALLLVPIAQALSYAHRQSIVHRDVKPSNILITESGEPMLSDFGVARILDLDETAELTATGIGIGTPEYMAPEQFQGARVDGRADVYALGVVFYEMITGRKPYQADTPAAIIWKQASEPLPRPSKFASGLPNKVEQIIFKALAKDPRHRYQSMNDFDVALEGLVPQRKRLPEAKPKQTQIVPVDQIASSPRRQLRTFWANKRILWLTGGSGLVLLAASLIFATGVWGQNAKFSQMLVFAVPTSTRTSTLTPTHTPTLTPTSTHTPTLTPTRTPSPTPTSIYVEGHELFKADFENKAIGGWKFGSYILHVQNPSQYWSVQQEANGNSVLFGNVSETDETGISIGSSSWSDYALELRANVIKRGSDVNQGGFGISVRNSTDRGCPLAYEMGFGKWWFLGKISGPKSASGECSFVHLVDAPHRGILLEKWFEVRVELFGSKLKVYVDDRKVHDINVDSSPRGGFGIAIGNGAQVYFDDIRVWELKAR